MSNVNYYYKNIGASYSTYVDKLNAVLGQSDLPTGKFVVGAILSGSYHTYAGFLDDSKNGFIVFGNFNGGGLFKVYGGTATQI